MERKPPPTIFMVSTILLITECSVVTHKDVDTAIRSWIVERFKNLIRHSNHPAV